jgi:PKD repeat protein
VKLTVTDKDGAQGSDTATVQVTAVNQPPKAVISGPTKGIIGEVLTFSGNSSSDSDGNIVTYLWNFGDGVTGNGANLSHTYGADGTYQVTLTVTDNEGQTHSATYPVQIDLPVVKLPPLAVVTAPVTATVSQTITFDGSASTDNDGSIVSYGWDFGDGTTATGDIVPHLYEIAGTYLVSLTVTDNDGLTTTVMASIEIN